MGVIYRVKIAPLNNRKSEESVILKVLPQNPQQRNQYFAREDCLSEALAFEEVNMVY